MVGLEGALKIMERWNRGPYSPPSPTAAWSPIAQAAHGLGLSMALGTSRAARGTEQLLLCARALRPSMVSSSEKHHQQYEMLEFPAIFRLFPPWKQLSNLTDSPRHNLTRSTQWLLFYYSIIINGINHVVYYSKKWIMHLSKHTDVEVKKNSSLWKQSRCQKGQPQIIAHLNLHLGASMKSNWFVLCIPEPEGFPVTLPPSSSHSFLDRSQTYCMYTTKLHITSMILHCI